jgi:hypothetical protein
MIRRPFASVGLLGLALTVASTASAHLTLTAIDDTMPVARQEGEAGGNQLKNAPCGQTTDGRTATVTALTAGAQVTIHWEEYIDHPGFFRIAFDPDGSDSFPVIANMDDVTPNQCGVDTCMSGAMAVTAGNPVGDSVLAYVADGETSATITVPNMNCENCTLQVIQFMTDKLGDNNDNEIYYQCADITITGGAAGGAGGAGGGGAGGGGAGGAAAGAGGVAGGGAGGAAAGASGGGAGGAAAGAGGTAAGAGGAAAGAGGAAAGAAGQVAVAGSAGTTPIAPAAPAAEEESGCAIAHSAGTNPLSWMLLGVAAFLFGSRRRR